MSHMSANKDDIVIIQKVVLDKAKVSISPVDACSLWEEYSSNHSASWLGLPKKSEDIWACLSTLDLTNYVGWTATDLKYSNN